MDPKITLDLRGKSVLVTGASRGIGRETAIRMGLAGARVAVNYNRGEAEAAEVVAEIGNAVAVRADLAAPRPVARMIDEIVGQIPLRRVGTVDDVAAVILFLASPMADYLNGVTIDVNGGSWFQ